MPEISIIVPVYKVEKYIHQCIDSIIGQTFKDIEIIIVDDGSPDNCPKICDEYAAKDSRIRVFHQPNKGLGGARNTGMNEAKGKYIAFVDSDDWIAEDYCEKIYANIVKYESDVILIGETLYFEDSAEYKKGFRDFSSEAAGQKINKENFISLFTTAWGRIYKKSFLDANKLRFVENCYYEDNSWGCFMIMLQPTNSFAGNPYYYRQRSDSITGKKDEKVFDFVRDYDFFESCLPLNNQQNDNYILCLFWYLINFYHYYFQLSEEHKAEFYKLIQKTVKKWCLNRNDFNQLPFSRSEAKKIYHFYNQVKNNQKIKENTMQMKIYLFDIILLFSLKKKENRTTIYLFGKLPLFKIKDKK